MYYRVAFQVNQQPTWQWRSTALTSLEALFRFLRLYSVIPQDRLRVFSSTSREMTHEVSESRARTSTGTLVAADANPSSNESGILPYSPAERSISVLESRRLELEFGEGGDHDSPYTFALPLSMPQTLAWVQLFVKVQQGNVAL